MCAIVVLSALQLRCETDHRSSVVGKRRRGVAALGIPAAGRNGRAVLGQRWRCAAVTSRIFCRLHTPRHAWQIQMT